MAFRFKHFSVDDQNSTMRFGTDAMLLGAWASPPHAGTILDIGTGCGVLALMMAQKSGGQVTGIDIDPLSVAEAAANFSKSSWSDRLTLKQVSLQEFARGQDQFFDFIITNPPYFTGSLKSPSSRRNSARHNDQLSFPDLVAAVASLLRPAGRFALVLPATEAGIFQGICQEYGLGLSRILSVRSTTASAPGRVLMEFRRGAHSGTITGNLTILGPSGKFSSEYLTLTREFHHF